MRNETNNQLYHYVYDPDYEKLRKYHLEKFIMRPKEKNEEEKNLLEELKRIEQVFIKKEFYFIYFNISARKSKKKKKNK